MANWNLPWFPKWNKENPTDIYGPAIAVGVAGGAVVVAAVIIAWGWPWATEAAQTGPRGTGMSVVKFESDLAEPDPTVEAYFSQEVYEDEGGPRAGDVYENVQVLGHVSEDNFLRLMGSITQWVAPEQGCGYCHAKADEGEYAGDDLYTKVVSRRMIQMTQALNDEWAGHVNVSGEAGVNCYTCHRGQNVPSGIWFKVSPIEVAEGWGAVQNYATDQTVSTSLPHDALEKLLVEEGKIKVHDLEPRVAGIPGQGDLASIQDTERTYSLMNYFANSLGVNCTFCHNTRAFYDPAQHTPQWGNAFLGIDMVRAMNSEYLVPLKDTYPENRLGPAHGDAPKAACSTCHKGANRPMGGMDMISDWPELAAPAPE